MSLHIYQPHTQVQGKVSPGHLKRLLTFPVRHTRLHKPAPTFQLITLIATTLNMMCRDPFKARPFTCPRRPHLATPPSITRGTLYRQMADPHLIIYYTNKIHRDTRLQRSLTLHPPVHRFQVWRQKDPRYFLVCLRSPPICQLMVAIGRFQFR